MLMGEEPKFPRFALRFFDWDHLCHRLASFRNDECLTLNDFFKQFGEVGLGVVYVYGFHRSDSLSAGIGKTS